MPLPNPTVVSALFESYINIRKNTWSLNLDTLNKNSLNVKAATSVKFVEDAQKATTVDHWVDILNDLATKIRIEQLSVSNSYQVFTLFKKIFSSDKPLLLETLCAARSYIISELDSKNHEVISAQFKAVKDAQWRIKNQIDAKILEDKKANKPEDPEKLKIRQKAICKLADLGDFKALMSASQDYHAFDTWTFPSAGDVKSGSTVNLFIPWNYQPEYYLSYFEQVTKTMDPKSKELGEKSFEDFKANAVQKKRPLDICTKLLTPAVVAPAKDAKTDLKKDEKSTISAPTILKKPDEIVKPKSALVSQSIITGKGNIHTRSKARKIQRKERTLELEADKLALKISLTPSPS